MTARSIFAICAIGASLMGCSQQEKTVNISHKDLPPQNSSMNDSEVGKLIIQAAAQRRWACGADQSNSLVCTQDARNIHLKVRIDYTKTDFSVTQLTEKQENLSKKILHRYNVWVKNLEKTILDVFTKNNLKNIKR